jgi:hypothetical protein
MMFGPETKDYVAWRTAERRRLNEIRRCFKRLIAPSCSGNCKPCRGAMALVTLEQDAQRPGFPEVLRELGVATWVPEPEECAMAGFRAGMPRGVGCAVQALGCRGGGPLQLIRGILIRGRAILATHL